MSNLQDTVDFPHDSTTNWRIRVDKELKGSPFEDHLVWKSIDGFSLDAWQNTHPNPILSLPPLEQAWQVVEPIYAADVQDANSLALKALMHGAEAIWFFKPFLGAASEVAIRGIDTKIAPVFIQGGNTIDVYRPLLKTGQSIHLPDEGTVFLNGKRFRDRGATVVEEIALLLAQAIEVGQLNGFTTKLLFGTSCGSAFLSEIAKIRALRWLWQRVLHREGQVDASANIIASNLLITYTQNDEHTNILRATSAAMSAVLGGANYVMIEPWDQAWHDNNEFSARISRNIQTLLKEESKLDKNLNAADGAYFLEHLTKAIAEQAWQKTQYIIKSGGFSAYAQSGELKSTLEKSASVLKKAYLEKKKVVLGVNAFAPKPPKTETSPFSSTYAMLPDAVHLPSYLQSQNN